MQIGNLNLIYDDCMNIMINYPDNYFDIAIVDPPYGLDKSSTHGRGKLKNRILNTSEIQKWDKVPDQSYFDELFRVSKNQIIWGGNYFDLPPTRGIIAWDKNQPWDNFSQFELAWTSYNKPAKMFRYSNRGAGNKEIKIHATQKPEKLYGWLLQQYATIDMKILDTHLGSASSAIAAEGYGISEFIGIEKDDQHYKDAINRVKNYTNQLRIL